MKQRVAEFVDQGLDRLRGGDIRTDRDLLAREVAVAVLTPAPIADHFEASCLRLADQGVPDSVWGVRVQELGSNRVRVREVVARQRRPARANSSRLNGRDSTPVQSAVQKRRSSHRPFRKQRWSRELCYRRTASAGD